MNCWRVETVKGLTRKFFKTIKEEEDNDGPNEWDEEEYCARVYQKRLKMN